MQVFKRLCAIQTGVAPFFLRTYTVRMFASNKQYSIMDGDTVEPISKNTPTSKKPFTKKSPMKESNTNSDINNDNRPRLQYEGVKIKPRGINYFSDEGVALTLDVTPAQYKNIDGTQYVVAKRGYFILRWVEYNNKTEELNYSEKRDFIISPINVDMILGIDAHNPKIDADGEVCFYEQTDNQVVITRVLRIQSQVNGDFLMMYAELQGDKKLNGQMMIRLKKGQFIVLQRMIEYALPSLYGWSAIYNPSSVEN